MTDDELDEMERDAMEASQSLHPRQLLALIAEVRRLRASRLGAIVEYKGRPPEWRTGPQLDRLEAAERLADATIENQDAWADAVHDARRWMASCDAWREELAAYRKAKGV